PVDLLPHLRAAARFPRRPRRLPARGGECRGNVLPLHESVAGEARSAAVTDLISVIVTTYNREDALDLALRALSRQTDRDFEVMVVDGGPGRSTAVVIAGWKDELGVPLAHVWQENCGFRAGEIRNRAIAASRGSYVVFLDGDCLARPDLVAQHRALAESGW